MNPATEATMRNAKDRYPKATVGSAGYLQITTPLPVIGVPDEGCRENQYTIV